MDDHGDDIKIKFCDQITTEHGEIDLCRIHYDTYLSIVPEASPRPRDCRQSHPVNAVVIHELYLY